MKRPRVLTRCVAHHYALPDERIIEFSHKGVGGLISFQPRADGGLDVYVYRRDKAVRVRVQKPEATR